jgi:hypothetical protein
VGNSILSYGNLADIGTLTGGACFPTLPLTNLQNRTLGRKARFINTDPANTWLQGDLIKDRLIRVVSLIGHNFGLSATYRVTFSRSSDFAVLVGDSGWREAWPREYSTKSLAWESPNVWSGKPLDEERQGDTWKAAYILPTPIRARFVRVEIIDNGAGNAYVQAGRLFIAGGWQPIRNISRDGFAIGWETGTQAQETLAGGMVFDRKTPRRVVQFVTASMTDDEAFGQAFEIMRRMGTDGEVFWIFDPDDTRHARRRQIYGHLRKLDRIAYPYIDGHTVPWEVGELI